MADRPNFIDLRSKSHDPSRTGRLTPLGLTSPRIAHVDGDIPPTLSPLDAFAAHGRLLAKQLDDSKTSGRRMSRLPPVTIANSLLQARPGCLRPTSAFAEGGSEYAQSLPRDDSGLGNSPEVEIPAVRPLSFYPRLSTVPPKRETEVERAISRKENYGRQHIGERVYGINEYFSGPRAQSPDSLSWNQESLEEPEPDFTSTAQRTPLSTHLAELDPTENPGDSSITRGYNPRALAPPRSPYTRQAASIRSVPADSSEDEYSGSLGGSFVSVDRKPSSSSGISGTYDPPSPPRPYSSRSPSISSEYSTGGSRGTRPVFNFSRPMSRQSRPSLDAASRKASSESQPYIFTDDTIQTPVSFTSEEYFDSKETPHTPAQSYIHTRFTLPRGRILQRNSMAYKDIELHRDQSEIPIQDSSMIPAIPTVANAPPSPPDLATPIEQRPITPTQEAQDQGQIHHDDEIHEFKPKPRRPTASPSVNSGSTIKPSRSTRSGAGTVTELSPEEHLAKGIECHEKGSVNESTYHLRLAARYNLPTAMLLYALACRHGWGMRPNPREGVQWLRKAADCASLEVADDEDLLKEGNPGDILERKARRAQFALSIYELGISHMNGWGIEQDKVLALRCFEIAGAWGDGDALAEAGFCYAQGVGCKKDLKKAAKFYRMAESKGMSMVGNSWIYKAKYDDDDTSRIGRSAKKGTPEKQPRDKSKSRGLFGRSKSFGARHDQGA
ncbi:MAG: hypothetical protein M1827_004338 [Pycnora praestabilis]|nr:MAG: hypothetical protein M1827_004338 [Pycnora praestabilis]